MISPFEEEISVEKKSVPFGSPGGKTRWHPLLIPMFPEHSAYVEPYIGGGAVFWNKAPCEKETINDLNPGIVGVYRFLQSGTEEDFAWMRSQKWKASKRRFYALLESESKTLREQAFRFKYLSIYSRRKAGSVWCKASDRARKDGRLSPVGGGLFLRSLEKFSERLEGVEVRCTDALKVMGERDGDGVFMYLDPPWKAVARTVGWREFDGAAFAEKIATMKAKLLVSYQGPLAIADNWEKESITMTVASGFAGGGYAKPSVQDVYANYQTKPDDEIATAKSFGHFFGV